MTLLYQVDFRTLPSQLTLSPGLKTIDSLAWWLKGSLSPGGGRTFAASLVNGSGLRLQWVAGTPSGIGSNADLTEPHWFLPLAGVPRYLAAQAMLVRGRIVRNAGNPVVTPLIGIVDTTSNATGILAAARVKDHLVGPTFSTGIAATLTTKFGAASVVSGQIGRAGTIANNECVPGILNNHLTGWAVHGSEHLVSGISTSVDSFLPASGSLSSTTGDPSFLWTTRTNPGVFFGFNSNNTGWIIDLQWLRIDVLGDISDTVPPTVTLISPSEGRMSRHATVTLRVLDSTGLSLINLWAAYANGITETIYADGEFTPAFSRSTITTIVADKEYEFAVQRLGGWPAGGLDFFAQPIDRGGNSSSEDLS